MAGADKGAAPAQRASGAAGAHGAGHAAEGTAHLIKMANDIGRFFAAEDRHEDAVAGVANHLRKFWSPRMREKLIAYLRTGAADPDMPVLEPLPREALERIAVQPAAKPAMMPGGDPGGDAG